MTNGNDRQSGIVRRGWTIALLASLGIISVASWITVSITTGRKQKLAQQRAVDQIHDLGGSVFGFSKNDFLGIRIPFGPSTGIIYVQLADLDLTDANLSLIRDLRELETIQIENCSGVDRLLAQIGDIEQIDSLLLSRNDVTIDGMKHLKGHPGITALHLQDEILNREMFEVIATLPKLEYLFLDGAQFEPEDFRAISGHKNLRSLRIADTSLGDDQVDVMLSLPLLEAIHFSTGQFSERSSQSIKKHAARYESDK